MSNLKLPSPDGRDNQDLDISPNDGIIKVEEGINVFEQFKLSNDMEDLNKAVALYRQGIQQLSVSSPEYPHARDDLANMLMTRFQRGGQQEDLDEAISWHLQALDLRAPPHPRRPNTLNNLASALWIRFQQGGQRSDLDEAISRHRQALDLFPSPHPLRSMSLNNLASALYLRYQEGGQKADIEEAISLNRHALELRAPPHPERSLSLNDLASTLSSRFEHEGQRSDLDEAITLHRQALELQPPPNQFRSWSLNNLASALSRRFDLEGQQSDLDEAILFYRQAIELRPPPDRRRPTAVNNLANALAKRFEQQGQRNDLDEAISLHRQVLRVQAPPNPHQTMSLASVLVTRFDHEGRQSDLDEVISLRRSALELFPPPHPRRAMTLVCLADVLSTRFKQLRRRDDIDEAILLNRQALELFPSSHPLRSWSLSNLGSTLLTRFELGGLPLDSDINEAILFHRQALELRPPPHTSRSGSLNNLAAALTARFKREGRSSDLDEAISLHRRALELRPPPHPLRSLSYYNLASVLSSRFHKQGQQSDLDEAISLHKEALELRAPPHPDRAVSLHAYGILLMHAHSLGGKNSDYLEEAMAIFSAATQCHPQSPFQRLRIANTWVLHANTQKHSSAMAAYEAALEAVHKLAPLSFDIQSRQEALNTGSDAIAREASILAIEHGNLDQAIEFLEAGRAIFWSQVLSLRSSVDQLHDISPELADRLRDIAIALDLGAYRDTFSEILDNRKKLTLDQEEARLNRLNEEWWKVIDEVRCLKGFENFLRPHRLSVLQAAASEYPLVILVGNRDGSHCLIMQSTTIQHIPLPILTVSTLKELVRLLQIAISPSTTRSFSERTREAMVSLLDENRGMRYKEDMLGSSDDVFRFVLKVLWDNVVKPVIDSLKLQKSGEIALLRWCPTGLFTFLPVHAAGCYDNELARECASDYFISSYTPTIGALIPNNPSPSIQPFKMMVVIQSQALSYTRKELEQIKERVHSDSLIMFGIPGAPSTVEEVASRLPDVAIAHFACHGKQDRSKPLNSGLTLEDGLLRVSRIMKERTPNGYLAFLCACETAMGDESLPDEAMSLGASLLFSGFPRVIATMWEMRDQDGPAIAGAFYEELFRGLDGKSVSELTPGKSARALHFSVQKLRSEKVAFHRWVPFVHMGQ